MITTTHDLTVMRGDTTRIGISIKGLTGTPDAITFSTKQSRRCMPYIFQKTLGNGIEPEAVQTGLRYVVTISPEDTEKLMPGAYCYDLEVIINGDVITLLQGNFSVFADVTRHLGVRS